MQGLQPRPGEGGQQEVVQEEGGADAERGGRMLRQPAVQEEEQVEEEERDAELDQDLGWDVLQKLPEPEHPVRILSVPTDQSGTSLTGRTDRSARWRPGRRRRPHSRRR